MYLDWLRLYIAECDVYFGYHLSLFRTFACCDSFTKSVQVILILWYLHFYCAVHTQHVHSALCAMVQCPSVSQASILLKWIELVLGTEATRSLSYSVF